MEATEWTIKPKEYKHRYVYYDPKKTRVKEREKKLEEK